MSVGAIGKYERLDVLGHGTSGVVYLAWDTLLRRQVALKEIRAAGPELDRVLEEARVLDRLGRHPHIVQIHSVDTQDGVILIDMELVRGKNLAEVLRELGENSRLPTSEALRIVYAVLDALAYAHERRIIHRDVKPANILIGADGSIKLTDFGLAEALGTGSVAGGGGTYPYMAPEDFAEDAASDYRSDLWAVGVVLYELLAGRRPFQVTGRRADPFAWKRAIQEDTPPDFAALRPDLPPSLDAIVRRALSREKSARFPNAVAFTSALQGAAQFLPAPEVSGEWDYEKTVSLPYVAANEPPVPFIFAHGVTVAYTLDELLSGAARHWDEARRALSSGAFEPFLRAVGEIYIADLAAELRARGGSEDQRLREFLNRSRGEEFSEFGDEAEEDDLLTVAATPTFSPNVNAPAAIRPLTAPTNNYAPDRSISPPNIAPQPLEMPPPTVARWWFWPLFLLCLGPLASAIVSTGHMHPSRTGRFNDLFEAWALTGTLAAMLLLAGIGARVPAFFRLVCGFPIAGGLIAAGAMASQVLGSRPTPDALTRIGAGLLLPLAVLLIEAATTQLMWRLWGWLVALCAIAATLHYVR